jgi:hypothetical protein
MHARAHTDRTAGHPRCGRCGQPIASRGIGEGFDHLATGPDGTPGPVEADHLAWWDNTAGRHGHVTDRPA